MTVEIVPAHRADLAAIDRFLEREWNIYRPAPDAGRMRDRNWIPGNDVYGLKLMVDGELAGFLGASYSLRPVNGSLERFCAIAPWYVTEKHRPRSLQMLFKLMADKDVTYVNLTPTVPMFRLFSSLGFVRLDEAKLLMPPLLNLAGYRPWRGRVVTDPAEVRAALRGDDVRIFDDHLRTRAFQIAIVEGDRVAYVAAGRRQLRNMTFAELLHVGEPALVGGQMERIVWTLCRHFRAVGVAADQRLLAGANVQSIRYALNSPPLFKSKRLAREQIDNLWSELAY